MQFCSSDFYKLMTNKYFNMDRSVDSIGSCSLDVDADSSELSDISSFNLLTPLSTKDITKEFTSKIVERCPLKVKTDPSQNRNVMLEAPAKGKFELKKGVKEAICVVEAPTAIANCQDKKPSYLSLACCVNGYSSITTYDSKIRQDINKSREVSPIRPSSIGIQYCKKGDNLAPPVQMPMPSVNVASAVAPLNMNKAKQQSVPVTTAVSVPVPVPVSPGVRYRETNSNGDQNGYGGGHEKASGRCTQESNDDRKCTSFIQQRVERLYGPGALAQGFFSPKKPCSSMDFVEFSKKLNVTTAAFANNTAKPPFQAGESKAETNDDVDLPVLRHLSQEFRAQLPSISPKRSHARASYVKANDDSPDDVVIVLSSKAGEQHGNGHSLSSPTQPTHGVRDEVDHKVVVAAEPNIGEYNLPAQNAKTELKPTYIAENAYALAKENGIATVKDGNYFLILSKNEQNRLMDLANRAEKYIDLLSNKPGVSDDILGILRSASGKARLLVSQKMQQFDGLCRNNLNCKPDDKFPTTAEDLQGFWDMVHLQVDNINVIYDEIEELKLNEWQKINVDGGMPGTDVLKKQRINKMNLRSKTLMSANESSNGKATSAATSAAAQRRDAQRKQLLELKRKNKLALAAGGNTAAVAAAAAAAAAAPHTLSSPPLTAAASHSCQIVMDESCS